MEKSFTKNPPHIDRCTGDTFDRPNVQDINVGAKDPLEAAANGHNYVDLGLRKTVAGEEYAVLFADRNIGADSPEDKGDFFSWGETSVRADQNNFNLNNYPFFVEMKNIGSDEDPNILPVFSKYTWDYTPNSINGIPDGKIKLDKEDDAASVIWGGEWKMPGKEEGDLLIDNTSIEWIENYNNSGISGAVISGLGAFSSAQIFFPENVYGDVAQCWLNTIDYWNYDGIENAGIMYFFNDEDYASGLQLARFIGIPIRPVLIVPSSWL